jgi:hypothetical protein
VRPIRKPQPVLSRETKNYVPRILRPAVRLLKSAGVSDAAIIEAVSNACRQHAREKVRGIEIGFDRLRELVDIVILWARDPEFVDDQGAPKQLSLVNEGATFQRLVSKSRVSMGTQDAVKHLCELRSARLCDKNRKIRLLSHVVLSVTPRHFVVAPVLDEMRRFLETIEHNVCTNAQAWEGRMQRTVMCWSLDPARFSEAQRFVRQNAQSFLDALDEKLSTCRSRERDSGLSYGAGVYVFVDQSSARRRATRRRT